MATFEKKILPEYFNAISSGDKNYDLRLNDFNCQKGDNLILKEIDPQTKEYTGRTLEKKITYIGKFKPSELYWTPEEVENQGLQIISFKPE